jgi:hypothetical protein
MLEIVEDDPETGADRKVSGIATMTNVPGLAAVNGVEDRLELATVQPHCDEANSPFSPSPGTPARNAHKSAYCELRGS